ncbi:MAG: glycerophosphodiester phosphodiesterase [Tetrasphaera sp.]|nr:glycerophosphodiester phosphodiesterase [Tetrasphaera sp.]
MRAADFSYFDAATPIALAHRGGTTYGPNVGIENTIRAFRHAVDLGFTHLETDVHATADGELIAFHDTSLDRVTNRTGLVKELPYAVVAEALIGGREPVPTLRELLTTFPNARINIDIKDDAATQPTLDLIDELGVGDRVCLGAFSRPRIREIRRRVGGRVATAAGHLGSGSLRFSPALLTRLVHTPAPVLQIPGRYRLRGREFELVTGRLVQRAHALGKHVHVWFYPWQRQDERAMHALLDLGVDGLVVDDLEALTRVFAARGHPLSYSRRDD